MARLLLPYTEKLPIPLARCIIHALLGCTCRLAMCSNDGKSCTRVNHNGKSFSFFFLGGGVGIVVGMDPFNQLAAVRGLGCYTLFGAHIDLTWSQNLDMQNRFLAVS